MESIERLRKFSSSDESVLAIFRQLVAEQGIEFSLAGIVTVTLRERDLSRVHDIVHEIDDRRVFYNAMYDETPQYMVQSVLEAKKKIHELRQGVWTNSWAEQMIERLLHELGEFLTASERFAPRAYGAPGFAAFEEAALKMRLYAWTIAAHFVVVFGKQVTALHLPQEIFDAVAAAYGIERKKRRGKWRLRFGK